MDQEPDAIIAALAGRGLVVERELGRGGMAIVYLARDLRNDRQMAVKVLRPGVSGGAERFVREIEHTSTLAPVRSVDVDSLSRGVEDALRGRKLARP